MLTYNPENKTYSKLIPIEELEGMKEKMRVIEERLKNTPINPPYTYETEAELDINDIEVLKKFLETEKFNINMAINRRRASLFLVAYYFTNNKDILAFLIERGSESIDMLIEYVNLYLKNGWQCQVGIGVLTQGLSYKVFYQAMIRG